MSHTLIGVGLSLGNWEAVALSRLRASASFRVAKASALNQRNEGRGESPLGLAVATRMGPISDKNNVATRALQFHPINDHRNAACRE